MRDSQKSRLYQSEWTVWHEPKTKLAEKYLDGSIKGAERYLRHLMKLAWFKRNFEIGVGAEYFKRIMVVETSGRRSSWSYYGTLMKLSKNGRKTELVILHELAHCLVRVSGKKNLEAHGEHFAGVMLFLVKKVMGAEVHQKLLDAYYQNRVAWNQILVPDCR